jgi:ubiquinone/menaquinone biosynthesis C-methylase UbiE
MTPDRGSLGWDDYAPFYDWENARTFGRRDVPFWRRCLERERGRVLELGCGTGRLTRPLARSGAAIVGLDQSSAMIAHAWRGARRLPSRVRPAFVRGDVRLLPFGSRAFAVVLAPYGLLQSLLTDADLDAALAEAARVLSRGGLIGIELVPELPAWAEHGPRVSLRGVRDGRRVTLVESVRQDRRRGLTIFDEEFVERTNRKARRTRFSLVFRTRPMAEMHARLERAGFRIDAMFGDYRGGVWHDRADAWLVLGRKRIRRQPPC